MKKRILFINDYAGKIGGAEKVLYDSIEIAKDAGFETFLITSRHENKNVNIFSIFNIYYYFRIFFFVRKHKIDIVHVHKIHQQISASIFLAIPKKTKVIWHVHDFTLHCPYMGIHNDFSLCDGRNHSDCMRFNKKRFDFIYHGFYVLKIKIKRLLVRNNIDQYVAPSSSLAKHLVSHGIVAEKIKIIGNFSDEEVKADSHGVAIEKNSFLFVGRLAIVKGVHILIQAMHILKEEYGKQPILYVIGSGPYEDDLKKLAIELGMNNIVFLGRKSYDEIQRYYSTCLATIIPSIRLENNPLVGVEALANGSPLIVSNIGGLSDFVDEGINGFLVKHGDANELMGIINNLLSLSKKKSQYMQNASIGLYKNKFTKGVFVKKLINLYMNLYRGKS